ncbi:MAG: dihydrolipoamide acetyltransferase family protein, partial [Acidimicrobiales bacterium]
VLAVLSDGDAPAAQAPAASPEAPPIPPPDTATPPLAPATAPPAAAAAAPPPAAAPAAAPPPVDPEPVPAGSSNDGSGAGAPPNEGKVLSPVVRRLIAEYGIDADRIEGTGLGGRISRDDVQRYIEANQLSSLEPDAVAAEIPAPVPAPPAPQPPVAAPSATPVPATQPGVRDAVVPLSNIRLKTGEHMVMSKSVAPHTLTAIEVDYEGVEVVRKAHGAEFKAQEGFSLTYLPFISRATIDALREYPHLNASVGDRELVVHNYVNLGIAVDLDFQGLLAPVVRDADGKRMRSIARDIVDVARRARSKQLSPDDLSGGTFTLTNAGSYGTMMQFPIINQPQVAILSTDAVKRKPVVVEDDFGNESIAIHSVGVLAMAWDHRAIDGAYAAAFLARIKEIIETRDWETELG